MSEALFSELAEADLADIWFEIAKDDLDRADRFVEEFRELATHLAEQPLMDVKRPELGDGIRSFPHGQYLLIYRPMKEGVGIARVVHGRRNLPQVPLPPT